MHSTVPQEQNYEILFSVFNVGVRAMSAPVFEVTRCEVCLSPDLTPVLDLGLHPMCDDLVPVNDARVCQEYPIRIMYCPKCCTAHQKYQVPKQELFPRTYHYRSRFTADVLNGMRSLVARCEERVGALQGKKVLDIGCNDGSLLSFFRERGAETCGIEPTGAFADAQAAGHDAYNDFLTPELADLIVAEKGKPDIIVFTNVFAHIEDLGAVLDSLRRMIAPGTIVIIENHYLGAVLDGNQFDTFYHEHPRTYSLTSFQHIAKSLDLPVSLVEFPARYGGNIRLFLGPAWGQSLDDAAKDIIAVQAREDTFLDQFGQMERNIRRWRTTKRAQIEDLVKTHGPLSAKAFPGRAAILVKLLGLDVDLVARVHEKPGSMKIGHYLPGTRIQIVSDEELITSSDLSRPILNMAWHIGDEIRRYMSDLGYTGQIIDIVSEQDFA